MSRIIFNIKINTFKTAMERSWNECAKVEDWNGFG